MAQSSTGRASRPRRASSTDPGALLSASDEPKGNAIKVVIGLLILAARARVLDPAAARRGQGGIPRE